VSNTTLWYNNRLLSRMVSPQPVFQGLRFQSAEYNSQATRHTGTILNRLLYYTTGYRVRAHVDARLNGRTNIVGSMLPGPEGGYGTISYPCKEIVGKHDAALVRPACISSQQTRVKTCKLVSLAVPGCEPAGNERSSLVM
jgi:hypothetical protein